MLATGAANKGQEQPTDDATQDEVKEQGEVIGQAEIVEAQAGTSGDPLGVVRGNVFWCRTRRRRRRRMKMRRRMKKKTKMILM